LTKQDFFNLKGQWFLIKINSVLDNTLLFMHIELCQA
jgi:hypothetical protein